VRRCAPAHAGGQDILDSLRGGPPPNHGRRGVCVYHNLVETAVEALAGSGIPVAARVDGFQPARHLLKRSFAEIRASRAAGAQEITS